MVLASGMVAAVAAGSALMVMARSIWAQIEPTIIVNEGAKTDGRVGVHADHAAETASSSSSSSSRSSSRSRSRSRSGLNPSPESDHEDATSSSLLHGVDVSRSKYFGRRRVLRALEMAAKAHEGQIRKTMQPYVTHCIETALIVEALLSPNEDDDRAEDAVVSALLHDAIDDGGLKPDVIGTAFGENVMSMVTKVSQLSATNQLVRRKLRLESSKGGDGDGDAHGDKDDRNSKEMERRETEKLRTMIVTMVSEPLVIVIKLADRLHNMRTV